MNTQLQFSKDFEVVNFNLSTTLFSSTKTGPAIADELLKTINEWNLQKKVHRFHEGQGIQCCVSCGHCINEIERL